MTSVNEIFGSAIRFFNFDESDSEGVGEGFKNSVDYAHQCSERDSTSWNGVVTHLGSNPWAYTTFALVTVVTVRFFFSKKKSLLNDEEIESQVCSIRPLSEKGSRRRDELKEKCRLVISPLFVENPSGEIHFNELMETICVLDRRKRNVLRIKKGVLKVETYNEWYFKLKGKSIREGRNRADSKLFKAFTLSLKSFLAHKRSYISSQPEFKKFVSIENKKQSCSRSIYNFFRRNTAYGSIEHSLKSLGEKI